MSSHGGLAFRCVSSKANLHVFEREVSQVTLRQAVSKYTCPMRVTYGDVAEGKVGHRWRALAQRPGTRIADTFCILDATDIEEIEHKGSSDAFHYDVAGAHVFNPTAAATTALKTQPPVSSLKDAIGNGDITNIAAHLASTDNPAMSMDHGAVRNRNVFTRLVHRTWGALGPALQSDAVIPHVEMAIANTNIATGVRVDPVGVGTIARIVDRHAMDYHVLATHGIDGPLSWI